jgi:hypothetical protein
MEAAWSIHDDRDRHHPDGKNDDWNSDAIISDDESDDDKVRFGKANPIVLDFAVSRSMARSL